MNIGYARVSKIEQKLDRQIDSLKEAKCEKIFQESITGTTKNRPELMKLLEQLRKDDVIVVTSLTRLSRSTRDLFSIVDQVHAIGAYIKSLKESWLDTSSSAGQLMFTLMAGINQFERDIIAERTREGLKAARARGRKGGRPRIREIDVTRALNMYNCKEYSVSEICSTIGISKPTLYRYIKVKKEVE